MDRPLRTLLFSTLYPSSARPLHGLFVETRLRELLKSGAVESRVVAPVPWFPSSRPRWGTWARMAATPRQEHRHGIEVLHPRYLLLPKVGMTLAPLALALATLPVLRRLIREGFDFDVIDAHYFYPDGVAAALLSKWLRKPLTITARGSDLNLIPRHLLPRWMMRWAARRSAASIGVSAALTGILRDWNIAPHKLHVIRNGVDTQRFAPEPAGPARTALGIDAGPVLLSVGNLVELKGHHIALQALPAVLRRHPRALLAIIGDGSERAALQRQAAALGVAGHVRFPGALPNEQLPRWYSAADVLILASSREGWPNVLLEAMACGTPVVATDVGGVPEVLARAPGAVLVKRRDAATLADAVEAVLAACPDREAVRRYAQEFSWEHTSCAQLELFQRLAWTPMAVPRA